LANATYILSLDKVKSTNITTRNVNGYRSTDIGNNIYSYIKKLFLLKKKNRFDGINIDYKYPRNNNEADQFVNTLRRLRKIHIAPLTQAAIISYSPLYLLLVYIIRSNSLKKANQNSRPYQLPKRASCLDRSVSRLLEPNSLRLRRKLGHPSTPFNTDQAIDYYTSHGVASYNIVLGIPLYGRAFTNTSRPSQLYSSTRKLLATTITRGRVYSSAMIPLKLRVKKGSISNLRALVVELSSDRQGDDSLITTVVNTLRGIGALDNSDNQLSYPISKYDNLKACFWPLTASTLNNKLNTGS
ncbi:hypothetical protein N7516_008139, partial [Penicillium verrucosum]|uniref:uncharacterized protein n=1 Tax=Penicillium verrucosum TaxID=60171 RepID=UPI002545AF86